mmetsp:Transcript_29526/g.55238  ORF Transcript_29526/g.55238 Transcript_29526/m.55238 type:complete len:95 (+) Transcript_29526:323-607(+)
MVSFAPIQRGASAIGNVPNGWKFSSRVRVNNVTMPSFISKSNCHAAPGYLNAGFVYTGIDGPFESVIDLEDCQNDYVFKWNNFASVVAIFGVQA